MDSKCANVRYFEEDLTGSSSGGLKGEAEEVLGMAVGGEGYSHSAELVWDAITATRLECEKERCALRKRRRWERAVRRGSVEERVDQA